MTERDLITLLRFSIRETTEDEPLEVGTEADLAILVGEGLIAEDWSDVTEKGQAYIAALKAVPLPVQRWVIPEVRDAVVESQASPVHGGGSAQPANSGGAQHQAKRGRRVRSRGSKERDAESSDEGSAEG